MTSTLLYVSGSRECHSKLTEEMQIPLRPVPREHSSSLMLLYMLDKSQKLANQSTGSMEGISAILLPQKSVKHANPSRCKEGILSFTANESRQERNLYFFFNVNLHSFRRLTVSIRFAVPLPSQKANISWVTAILFYYILGCVLPLQEAALDHSPPTFSFLCYPCPYCSLLPHNVISPTFWSCNWSYTLYLPLCTSKHYALMKTTKAEVVHLPVPSLLLTLMFLPPSHCNTGVKYLSTWSGLKMRCVV